MIAGSAISAGRPLAKTTAAAMVTSFLLTVNSIAIRSRWSATTGRVGIAIAFDALNRDMFGIGIFPSLGMAATLLVLDAGWPRRLAWLRGSA